MTASRALRRGTQVGLFVIAAAAIVASTRLGLWGFEGPGSGLFPLVAGIIMLGCVAVRLALPDVDAAGQDPVNWPRVGWYVISLALYVVLFLYAGFAIATIVGVFLVMRFAEQQPVLSSLLATVITTLGCILLFDYLLAVPLPYGPLQPFKFWM